MSAAIRTTALFLLDVSSWSDWRRWWGDQRDTIGQHGTRIIIIVLLLLALELLFRHVLRRMFVRAVSRAARVRNEDPMMVQRRADTLAATLQWAFGIFLLFLGSGLVLAEVGLNVSALIAGVGVVGIALGLGAQTLVKDVINGMFILIEDQYGVGDLVTAAGATGTVIEINPRRTVLRDGDGNVHSIPNSAITVAVNRTPSLSRVHIALQVPFRDCDRAIELANSVGRGILEGRQSDVITVPSVTGQSAVNDNEVRLEIVGDVRQSARWAIESELRRQLKRRFDAERLEAALVTADAV